MVSDRVGDFIIRLKNGGAIGQQDDNGDHKIRGVKRVSKPGRRLYAPAREVHTIKNGMGARIMSTPKGILSDSEARKVRQGGETLFEIW